ncbi:MAG: hypothetical protein ACRC46_07055 [Thermoguttaceae bacterium]
MSNIRKVALFFLGLDLKTADVLMQRLDRQTAHAVRREMLAIQDASPQDVANVSKEFVREVSRNVYQGKIPAAALATHTNATTNATVNAPNDAGIYSRPVVKRTASHFDSVEFSAAHHVVLPPSTADAVAVQPNDGADAAPFAFLKNVATSLIAEALAGESVATLAVVLAYIDTDVAREILATFPTEQQVDVMRRLSQIDEADPENVRMISETLEHRLASKAKIISGTSRGLSSARQLFASLDANTRDEILQSIDNATDAAAPTPQTQSLPETSRLAGDQIVAELESLDDDIIAALVRRVDPCAVMVGIAGTNPVFIERILTHYSPMERDYVAEQLQRFAPLEKQDTDVARLVLGNALRELRREKTSRKTISSRQIEAGKEAYSPY